MISGIIVYVLISKDWGKVSSLDFIDNRVKIFGYDDNTVIELLRENIRIKDYSKSCHAISLDKERLFSVNGSVFSRICLGI